VRKFEGRDRAAEYVWRFCGMNTVIEARIARVARVRGCSFYEAARLVAGAAVRRRRERKASVESLNRLRGAWHWRRDFE